MTIANNNLQRNTITPPNLNNKIIKIGRPMKSTAVQLNSIYLQSNR